MDTTRSTRPEDCSPSDSQAQAEPEAPDSRNREPRTLPQRLDSVLEKHFEPLDAELLRLSALARQVFEIHGATHWQQLAPVLRAFGALRERLRQHRREEETALFCGSRTRGLEGLGADLAILLGEHKPEEWLLHRLRRLTEDYCVPPGASPAWITLWRGLEALEQHLYEHIRFESQILMPRLLRED